MNFLSNIQGQLPVLVPILAGIAIVALVFAIGFIAARRGASAESRLELFTRKGGKTSSAASVEIWKDAAFDSDKKNFLDQLIPKIPTLDKVFQQADVNIKPSALLGIAIVLAIIGTGTSMAFQVPVGVAVIPGLILFAIPWWWVFSQRRKRLKNFMTQMPDAMELLARALRAGQSLQAGLQIISEEMPPPIAIEFGRVYEEQNLGINLDDSLKALCERVPNLDLRFFVTSVVIQRQTGGDMAEILDKIGYVIRERFKIWGQVQALTGEGRMSGTVLIALPFVMLLAVMHLNYEYVSMLWTTDKGQTWSMYALIMQVLGALTIRKIVNIKV